MSTWTLDLRRFTSQYVSNWSFCVSHSPQDEGSNRRRLSGRIQPRVSSPGGQRRLSENHVPKLGLEQAEPTSPHARWGMLDEEDEKLLSAKPRRRRGAGPEEEEAGKHEGADSARGSLTSREERGSERAREAKSPTQEEEDTQTPRRATQARRLRKSTSKVVPMLAEADDNAAAYFEETDTAAEGRKRRTQKTSRARRPSEGAGHVDRGARRVHNEQEDLGTDYL